MSVLLSDKSPSVPTASAGVRTQSLSALRHKWFPVSCSFADQALAVGGVFLANVVLARTQTKEEYGAFVLCYSIYTLLYGVFDAAVLDPFTVYASGRYRNRYSQYLRLMARSSVGVGIAISVLLFMSWAAVAYIAPQVSSRSLAGLALAIGFMLCATFLRRAFYVQRQAPIAAMVSFTFACFVACGLWLANRLHFMSGFSIFLVLATGWLTTGLMFTRKLTWGDGSQDFSRLESGYWQEHWNYSRWALASAIVLQLNTQGYYWLVAGFLSVKDVADLRAMYLLVAPIENIFVAISFIILPAMAAHHAANRMPALIGTWKLNALAVVVITGLFAIAVRLFGRTLIHVVYAGKFDGLAPLLYLLVLSPMLVGIAGTIINALKAVERPKTVCYAYGCSGVVTFLVAVPLVHQFGLRGAVYGMLVSGTTLVISLVVLFMIYIYKGSRANVSRVQAAETHVL